MFLENLYINSETTNRKNGGKITNGRTFIARLQSHRNAYKKWKRTSVRLYNIFYFKNMCIGNKGFAVHLIYDY